MVNTWNFENLKHFELLKNRTCFLIIWNSEMLMFWNFEILKLWTFELWNSENLKFCFFWKNEIVDCVVFVICMCLLFFSFNNKTQFLILNFWSFESLIVFVSSKMQVWKTKHYILNIWNFVFLCWNYELFLTFKIINWWCVFFDFENLKVWTFEIQKIWNFKLLFFFWNVVIVLFWNFEILKYCFVVCF